MKKFIVGVATFVVSFALVLIFVGQQLPNDYKIDAVEVIDTNPEAVYAKIANLKEWPSWSPWKKEDPSMSFDFSKSNDIFARVGDSYSWSGKDGPGTVKITEVLENSILRYDVIMPGMSTPSGFFSINTSEGKTSVFWSVKGSLTLIEKIIWRFFRIESDMQSKLIDGLTNIRTQLEKK